VRRALRNKKRTGGLSLISPAERGGGREAINGVKKKRKGPRYLECPQKKTPSVLLRKKKRRCFSHLKPQISSRTSPRERTARLFPKLSGEESELSDREGGEKENAKLKKEGPLVRRGQGFLYDIGSLMPLLTEQSSCACGGRGKVGSRPLFPAATVGEGAEGSTTKRKGSAASSSSAKEKG